MRTPGPVSHDTNVVSHSTPMLQELGCSWDLSLAGVPSVAAVAYVLFTCLLHLGCA